MWFSERISCVRIAADWRDTIGWQSSTLVGCLAVLNHRLLSRPPLGTAGCHLTLEKLHCCLGTLDGNKANLLIYYMIVALSILWCWCSMAQNTIQKSISIVISASAIHHNWYSAITVNRNSHPWKYSKWHMSRGVTASVYGNCRATNHDE
jgi:hypothetical protein